MGARGNPEFTVDSLPSAASGSTALGNRTRDRRLDGRDSRRFHSADRTTRKRLYPVGSEVWRRVLIPVLDSLGVGYLLFRHFPEARGSGVPQTKAGLFAHDGVITARTAFGNSFALPLRSQAGSRLDARSLLSRSEVELLRCWAVAWDGAPMDKSHSSPQRSER
jgi:H+/Cl- antiporter ClcA